MTILSEKIAHLSPEKQRLLEKLLKKEGVDLERSVILPQPRDKNEFPLSFAQQRLWFLDQLEPNSPLYNIPVAVQLQGPLDRVAFSSSLNEIVRRHEALRTVFRVRRSAEGAETGEPVQVILPELEIGMTVLDLRGMYPAQQQVQVEQLAVQEAQRPFDLSQGPLLRVTLLDLAPAERVMLVTMHHIISDGWSMNVFVRELVALYESFCTGAPSPLPELTIQYADYAHWQRQWFQDKALQEHLAYWRDRIRADAVLALPTDRSRPPVQTFRGASHYYTLDKGLSAELEAFSHRHRVTLFMTLLAAFQTLLYRYTGQDEIHVGTPVANRNRGEIEPLIGFFVNTLVMNARFAGDPSFRKLLSNIRETALGAFAHQDLPFERLVQEIDPERDLSHTPLFQVMFALQNAQLELVTPAGLTVKPLAVHTGVSSFDLTLLASEGTPGLDLVVEYNTDLFDAETIIRMVSHFEMLLKSILIDPDQRVSQLALLDANEVHRIVHEWNDTRTDRDAFGSGESACRLFELRAAAVPDAVAVVCGDMVLTYSQLDQRANQLAHYLRQFGVGSETLVGLAVGRSLELIVGLLGILKAGGAYLPLDPDYPLERLAFMVEDAKISVLVTQQDVKLLLPPVEHTICLDADQSRIACQSAAALPDRPRADSAAYVIYTSGSTGRPKGVVVSHRAMTNHNLAVIDEYGIRAHDRILQFSTIGFDGAVEEIFPFLIVGATLVLRTEGMIITGQQLVRLIQEHLLTVLDLPTAYWHEWVYELSLLNEALPRSLRLVIVGGEEASAERLVAWQTMSGQVAWINSYGPTETTVIATCYPVVSPWHVTRHRIPIGHPIANMCTYVLDSHLQPMPIGLPGELYIGGVGVARGYLNRPTETASSFLPDPFAADSGSRLYKSGDLMRYLPDGNTDFLGRVDHQVKIRGFRIEPEEIEALLAQCPGVRNCAVLASRDGSGSYRLNAYVVPMPQLDLRADTLRDFLGQRLPEYMVPQTWTWLESLPLTAVGKVDRRALPPPDPVTVDSRVEMVNPRTPTEEILAGMWAQVLGLPRVSIYANFFQSGGHSLLATQLVSRIRHYFRVELPVRDLFDTPTIAGLASRIDAALREGMQIQAPPIAAVSREGELPLSFAQQRLWFLDQLEPNSAFYNLPETVRLVGPLDEGALARSLNEIVRRHEALRTTFETVEGKPVQRIAASQVVEVPVVDLSYLPRGEREAETRRLAQAEAQRPFDLGRGPLLRVVLVRLGEQEHAVLLTMHHIVGDNWSSTVLFRELAVLYDAYAHGRVSPLPELAVQYADYAYWQRAWLQGEVLQRQLGYWSRQLAGVPPLLELPTDRPRPAVQTVAGSYHTFELGGELAEGVRALCRKEGVTLFMALLAGFQALLHRYSGQDDICVGTPIANRNRGEVEGLIGFFVNTLVMRAHLGGGLSFRELVRQVRGTALDAYAHQDLPFEMMVDAVQPDRNLSHSPLFQVAFALQSEQASELVLPGSELRLVPLEAHSGTAKFDLTLFVTEEEETLRGALEYNTDLFDAATTARMIGHLQTLLLAAVADPDRSVAALPLLTAAEVQELSAWNQTRAPFPTDRSLTDLFEAQAARSPAAVAVVFEDQVLTYGELNRRANQLAHYLIELGVGPETLVGLCVDRSLEMIIGILGILKAGGAYVPMDPAYPADRLRFMVQDTGMQVLLAQSHVRDRVLVEVLRADISQPVRVICLDSEWPAIARQTAQNPTHRVLPEHLAYIIYTSGSTGRPKGTMLQHSGVCNLAACYIRDLGIRSESRALQFFTYSFDGSVIDIFPTLLAGATVCIPRRDMLLSMPDLHRLMQEQTVTHALMPPSALNVLPADELPALERILSGGEACSRSLVERWAPGRRFYNAYGPTEITVASSWYEVRELPAQATSIPIGGPIANARYHILDRHLEPVPVGVPGELYIGGAGVARGYLNRPGLTAERFVPEPFAGESAARLYRTGDLARFLPDGSVEYMGRIDTQVKIRGFRIELGEIEAALGKHPAVRETAVLAREDTPGVKRLVAYIVPDHAGTPTVGELRDYLREQLPEYMVPSVFVTLNALPLMPSGKLDRQALPVPEGDRPELESTYLAPRTPQEQVLAEIWGQILGLDRVGVHDNFFELGGDSILSIQVIARANQAGAANASLRGLRLTPRQLFEHPTIAGLAAVAGTSQVVQAEQGIVVGPVPLTPIQHWLIERNLPEPNHWNQSLLLEIKRPLVRDRLERAVSALLAHHDVLRLRLERTSAPDPDAAPQSGRLRAYCADAAADLPPHWLDLSSLAADQVSSAIETHAAAVQSSLDLIGGPLLRIAYFDLGAGRTGRLLIVIHHMAVDNVSWRILLEDLHSAYEQVAQGIQLPPKTTSFQHWAQQLQAHAQTNQTRAELDYWLSVLREPGSRLPVDYPGGLNTEASASSVTVSLDAETTRALLREAPAAYRTEINDLLLTALAQSVSRWTGSRSVLVGLEGHGREDLFPGVDISRTVGWFTALYPVRLKLGKSVDPGAAITTIKEQLRQVPNRGIGYGLLRYLCADTAAAFRDLAEPELSFNYLGQLDQALADTPLFGLAAEARGCERSLNNMRPDLINVNGGISDGCLNLEWSYSKNLHRRETIEAVAQDYMAALRALVVHCQSPEAGGVTPADFGLAHLDQRKLDKVLSKIKVK